MKVGNALCLVFVCFVLFVWSDFGEEIIVNKDLDWKLSLRDGQDLGF